MHYVLFTFYLISSVHFFCLFCIMHYVAMHSSQQRKIRPERESRSCVRDVRVRLSDSNESRENDYVTIGDKRIITLACSVYLFANMYGSDEGSIRCAIIWRRATQHA